MAKWVVAARGGPNKPSFEIAVVREDNKHGLQSYGWFGEDKLLITHNGGPCRWPLIPEVWDAQIKLANEIRDKLNRGEIHGFPE